MTGSLSGRGAVVTGGGRGIGAAIARALASEGASVLVAARTRAQVEALASELEASGARAFSAVADVTDPTEVARLKQLALEHLGQVDILVNNVGAAHSDPLERITLEDWQRLMAVNATSTFLCTQAFVPGMVERRWGRVVNVASIAGLSGGRYIAAYSAAKHAVVGFTRSVAAEVAQFGVTVNAVCPGYVDTPMTEESIRRIMEKTGRSREQVLAAILETTPQRRLIAPEEVAAAALALCLDSARGINGHALVIDGGALGR